MRFVSITNENFEDIFQVSAKYEQWEYVKHHIFDMVNNYVAVMNREYFPLPFLVYENDSIIGFVQVNHYDKKPEYEICKLIVHETEQNKGYGKKILSEIIKWLCSRYPYGKITASYKASNPAADKIFSCLGFEKSISGEEILAVLEMRQGIQRAPDSEFQEIPYANMDDMLNRIKGLGKYPQDRIGREDEIHWEKIDKNICKMLTEMHLHESQEEYVMPFVDSLAQSYSDLFEDEITVSYALCDGKNPVGLTEIRYVKGKHFPGLEDKMVYELFRILVDQKKQQKGYGTETVRLFLDYVRTRPLGDAEDIVVSVVEGNDVALRLYEKMGFQIIGRDTYGHIALHQTM